jgi:hypothetical protein
MSKQAENPKLISYLTLTCNYYSGGKQMIEEPDMSETEKESLLHWLDTKNQTLNDCVGTGFCASAINRFQSIF